MYPGMYPEGYKPMRYLIKIPAAEADEKNFHRPTIKNPRRLSNRQGFRHIPCFAAPVGTQATLGSAQQTARQTAYRPMAYLTL